MAELIDWFELELRILLLPPISRSAHLAGPAIHAGRLVELWKSEDDVPLEQAFRLLDAETVARAIFRTALMSDNDYPNDPVHWPLPPLGDLLPELRDAAWEALLDGKLRIEAIRYAWGKAGKGARPVPLVELQRLSPDWQLSRLCRGDHDEYIEARVRRAPAEPSVEPPKRPPRAALRAELLKGAMEEIAQGYPEGARPPAVEIEAALKTRLPWVTRQEAREALAKYAPWLRGERGRPRLRKSPD